jgi:di/tricarboxylate transporter
MALHERHGVNLLAISRSGHRLTQGLRDTRLRAGDVIVLQGPLEVLAEQLGELGCLPLAERPNPLGSVRKRLLPLIILGIAMALAAFAVVPAAVAFFGAAVLVILLGALPVRGAYEHIEWPILVMLGALIPVSEALQTSGGTELISGWLSAVAVDLPPWAAVGLILIAAMAATPFLNNAATVLVMAPIAATFAKDLQMRPDARGGRRGLRLPHPDRPPVQYPGDGSGRLPLRRLRAARRAALGADRSGGRPADPGGLAGRLSHLTEGFSGVIGSFRPAWHASSNSRSG